MSRLRFTALVAMALAPAAALAWQTALPGTPGASRPFAVAVGPTGEIAVAGRAVGSNGNDDAVLAKLAGTDGTIAWQRTFAGTALGSDLLRAVAVDAAGDVVAAGQVQNAGTAGDMLLVAYDADGNARWRRELDGGASLDDDGFAVTVDAAGAPVVGGRTTPAGSTTGRFTVLKLGAADGMTTWPRVLDDDGGVARAVVASGDSVYAAGDAGGRIVVVRLADADLSLTWRADVTGSASGAHVGHALAVGAGRVVVAGHVQNTTGGQDFAVVALDATTHQELWRATLDGTAIGAADDDDALDVAIDADGDVIAAGILGDAGTGDDGVVVKLAGATGAERWRVVLNGRSNGADVAQAIALAGDDVFVTGSLRNPNTRTDVLLGRLAGATGKFTWRLDVNGVDNGQDAGFAIASSGGHVVAATRLRDGAANGSIAVVKRTGANGGQFPCGDGHQDPGEACDDGNVASGDGCRANCTVEACGDGIRDPHEDCDDGNVAGGDCCSPTCTREPDATPCDDHDACTLGDVCRQGSCVATGAVPCTATDACDRAACDARTGVCSHTRRPDGAACNDGDVCTVLDQCIGGKCTGSGALTCQDDDPCTMDACVPALGCRYEAVTGFPALTCLFDRTTIARACPDGLPGGIRSALDRARTQITTAAGADKTPKVRRSLVAGRRSLQSALRATKKHRRPPLATGCAKALTDAIDGMLKQADSLRTGLVH